MDRAKHWPTAATLIYQQTKKKLLLSAVYRYMYILQTDTLPHSYFVCATPNAFGYINTHIWLDCTKQPGRKQADRPKEEKNKKINIYHKNKHYVHIMERTMEQQHSTSVANIRALLLRRTTDGMILRRTATTPLNCQNVLSVCVSRRMPNAYRNNRNGTQRWWMCAMCHLSIVPFFVRLISPRPSSVRSFVRAPIFGRSYTLFGEMERGERRRRSATCTYTHNLIITHTKCTTRRMGQTEGPSPLLSSLPPSASSAYSPTPDPFFALTITFL